MKLIDQAKLDNILMKLIKVSYVSHVIAHTSHGELRLRLPFGGTEFDYQFELDSVPLDKKINDQLLEYYERIQSK